MFVVGHVEAEETDDQKNFFRRFFAQTLTCVAEGLRRRGACGRFVFVLVFFVVDGGYGLRERIVCTWYT